MAEMLLINPRGRAKARKSGAKRARRRNPVRAASAPRRVRRRRNPIASVKRRVMHRASRTVRRIRRRRNPISLGSMSGYVGMLKTALIGGAGAVAMDLVMGQANKYLPENLQRIPGTVGVGDVVKAVITIALGAALSKPTKGLSKQAAIGALTVQAADVGRVFADANSATFPLGWVTPATRQIPGRNRVSQSRGALAAYANVTSPLLGMRQAGSPMLSGVSAAVRETVVR